MKKEEIAFNKPSGNDKKDGISCKHAFHRFLKIGFCLEVSAVKNFMKKEEIAFNKPSGKNPFGKNSEPESKTPSPHEEEKPEESISPSIEKRSLPGSR